MGVLSNKIDREQLKPGDHIYSWRLAYLYAHHGIYTGDGKVIHFTRGAAEENGSSSSSTRSIIDQVITFNPPPLSHPSTNATPCPTCGYQKKHAGVVSSCLDCFLWGGELYLFEYGVSAALFLAKARGGTCSLADSDPVEDVLHRAYYLLRINGGFGVYDLFENNCEDFAMYCKTGLLGVMSTSIGVGTSGQAASLLAATGSVVSSSLQLLTMANFAGFAAFGFGMYCVSRLVSDVGVRCDVTKVKVERLVASSASPDDFARLNGKESDAINHTGTNIEN
ncbi:Endopeptidase, NLPC/P60 domain containing protein [Parasponia andersonii]|uniref:Endopeptidase, NLPC/P60 domain containing protein n=1 Tax=Parasponia andersonii TaxID=3476 RepID=A0A2P5B778_PARAD|nr:Endopeptidase, NLPC/P60 domain containing protein [Parasponia andersonii]